MNPNQIEKQDMHIHTRNSNCVHENYGVKEVINKINSLDIKKFAITDHYYKNANILRELKLRKLRFPKIKIGLEIDYLDIKDNNVDKEIIKLCDVIIGSIHKIQDKEEKLTENEIIGRYINALKTIITTDYVDIIGHPFNLLFKYKVNLPKKELISVLELAKKFNKKIEFNERRYKTNEGEENLQFHKELFELCKLIGCEISLASDAHNLEDVGNIKIMYKIVSEEK